MNYEPYILNEANMNCCLKYKQYCRSPSPKECQTKGPPTKERVKKPSLSDQLFVPREADTLFWCYYIMLHGDSAYEMLPNKNSLTAKQLKIDYVQKIRENKVTLKIYKFDTLTNLESNLANDDTIRIQTVLALCAIDKCNVMFVRRNSYVELLLNDVGPTYIVREMAGHRYHKQYGYEVATESSLAQIRTLYKVDSLDKPVKGLSAYKVADLLDIARKLGLETTHTATSKQKTKSELYEAIVQYFR
ncbi:MAG: hypothetical protein ACOVRN_19940 [Flavobacterium sp.]